MTATSIQVPRNARLAWVLECGGPGSGRPGPCPQNKPHVGKAAESRSKASQAAKAEKKAKRAYDRDPSDDNRMALQQAQQARVDAETLANKHEAEARTVEAQNVQKKQGGVLTKVADKPVTAAAPTTAKAPATKPTAAPADTTAAAAVAAGVAAPAEAAPAATPAATAGGVPDQYKVPEGMPQVYAEGMPKPGSIREPVGKDQIPAHVAAQGKELESSLDAADRQALDNYTSEPGAGAANPSTSYENINKAVRAGGPDSLDPEARATFDRVNQIASRPLAEPVTTYRGVALKEPTRSAFLSKMNDAALSGEAVQFSGITSTSLDPEIAGGHAKGDVVFEIKAKTGAYIDPVSQVGGERELIQAHGTRYKVVAVQRRQQFRGVGSGVTVYQMQEL